MTKKKVVVLGGGIAGLTVAHELAKVARRAPELAFEVHVFEAEDHLGGKAESQFFNDGNAARHYPGEHGFRFFPHFYRHITQTLREIPSPDSASKDGSVYGLLCESQEAAIVYGGRAHRFYRANPHLNVLAALTGSFRDLDTQPREVARFAWDMLRFATSCPERRLAEYEHESWEHYLGLSSYSDHFARLLRSIPSNLSAMKAEHGSARTIGNTALQVLWDYEPQADHPADAVLAGPTKCSFLDAFQAHLVGLGVTFHLGTRIDALQYTAGDRHITGVTTSDESGTKVEADYYVLAVPIERAKDLITPDMRADDVGLRNLVELATRATPAPCTAPMVGVQFFLDRDIPIVKGHATLPYSEWALTLVSQQQFWSKPLGAITGDPAVRGLISVIISDWTTPGRRGKSAAECTHPAEILDEVWDQLKAALPGTFQDSFVLTRHLDTRVEFDPSGGATSRTPLLIHPTGSHHLRPHARTTIDNLLLASDYVRTMTDLATMEGADEAGRTAVAAILRAEGAPRFLWPSIVRPSESPLMEKGKRIDRFLFDLGLPHPMKADPAALERLEWSLTSGEATHVFSPESPLASALSVSALRAAAALEPHSRESVERWSDVLTGP